MFLSEKQQIVTDLHEKFKRSKVVILTDYKGLDVSAITKMRRQLRESGIDYKVVKNTLMVRAAENTDVAVISDNFKGPSGIALSYDDPVAPAKILMSFAKENAKLEVKVGVMNGKVLDAVAIKSLSLLPSREVLLGQLLSTMNAVPAGFVRTLNAIPQKLLNVLQAIKDQKEAA
ncbi:MAG: 50S ribosomal protein L10 [Desulfobacterales bacterium]|nr:50S ribosomal protein L10 [Desulfobacterales bacterium]MDD4070818.1 50S ribosomal protein L10 [Desulfobacterales bacterium]MDD4391220.1 50S ribosomal protein L10 [Desulfobacterales bacterium]